jgi:DNA-directed RNA polymerase subunit E"
MPRACRNCKTISNVTPCPVCKSIEQSDDYSGLLVVLNPAKSMLAEKLEAKEVGNYALKIR